MAVGSLMVVVVVVYVIEALGASAEVVGAARKDWYVLAIVVKLQYPESLFVNANAQWPCRRSKYARPSVL